MTNKKSTMTNVQALATARDLAEQAGMTELCDKLTRMHEQAAKKRNAPKTPTKEQLQTLAQVDAIEAKMRENGLNAIDTKWIRENIDYVTSAQKATAIMRKGMQLGKFVKGEPVKGRVQYLLAE